MTIPPSTIGISGAHTQFLLGLGITQRQCKDIRAVFLYNFRDRDYLRVVFVHNYSVGVTHQVLT